MTFENKVIQIEDFLDQLHDRVKGDNSHALIFFEIFLQNNLVKAIKSHPDISSDWDGRVNAGDFDTIYPLAAGILQDAATRNSTEHLDRYAEAHAISIVFCETLNEMFQCSGEDKYDLIPIKSYVDMAVEAGMVKVENRMVSLTPEGEEMARSVEREIESSKNQA